MTITTRRLLPVVTLMAAATFASSALGDPAVANAFDRSVWEICRDTATGRYLAGDITTTQFSELKADCCFLAGGVLSGTGCNAPRPVASTPGAPPSEAANPDVPSGSPPSITKPAPKTTFTLAPLVPAAPVG